MGPLAEGQTRLPQWLLLWRAWAEGQTPRLLLWPLLWRVWQGCRGWLASISGLWALLTLAMPQLVVCHPLVLATAAAPQIGQIADQMGEALTQMHSMLAAVRPLGLTQPLTLRRSPPLLLCKRRQVVLQCR